MKRSIGTRLFLSMLLASVVVIVAGIEFIRWQVFETTSPPEVSLIDSDVAARSLDHRAVSSEPRLVVLAQRPCAPSHLVE